METLIVFLTTGILLFWAGFVCAISFMEAWLKFRVPGVTLPIGLSIGRKVFKAMNRMEWIVLVIYVAILIDHVNMIQEQVFIMSFLLFLILAAQTFLVLPRLNKRTNLIIEGKSVAPSRVHLYYVFLELAKVILLLVLGYLSVHLINIAQ